jgi:hypothetical protein
MAKAASNTSNMTNVARKVPERSGDPVHAGLSKSFTIEPRTANETVQWFPSPLSRDRSGWVKRWPNADCLSGNRPGFA